jgi:hypothetical protein
MLPIRADLVFSYWVFGWFLLYSVFGIPRFSPKFALAIGLFENMFLFTLMLSYGTKMQTIVQFVFINTFIKVMPLYYLRHERIAWKDVFFTLGLFIVFVIWLHLNHQSMVGNMKLIFDSLLYGQGKTPLMSFLNQFQKNFQQLKII